jgi:hypothetical protein
MTRRALQAVATIGALVLVGLASYLAVGALVAPTPVTVVQTAALPAEAAIGPAVVPPRTDAATPGAMGLALIAWGSVLVLAIAYWTARTHRRSAPAVR